MIKHFGALFAGKRDELEEQQLHTNTGLRKLKDTEEEVSVRQAALTVKKNELERMDQQVRRE